MHHPITQHLLKTTNEVSPPAPETAQETQPEKPETVILYGFLDANSGEGLIGFEVEWSDGTITYISVPEAEALSYGDVNYTMDFLEISAAYAAENGLTEEAEPESDPERTCGTCAHIHAVPDVSTGEVDSPCTACGQDPDLPKAISRQRAAKLAIAAARFEFTKSSRSNL